MNHPNEGIEPRLARLKAQTAGVGPRAGYEERLMVLLGAAPANDAMSLLWRWGKFGVALSALAAAAGIVLALSSSVDVDQEEALAYGTLEYFE